MLSPSHDPDARVWPATLAGFCASLVGVGLARFGFSPLIPALIAAHWFTPSQAAYLGAANLAGYLIGALLARPLARWTTPVNTLRGAMLLAAASFFACAVQLPFLWFSAWRFASGVSGALLIVLAAPTILPHVPPARRGFVSGAIFTGVGVGVVASGTLVPLLLQFGLLQTWCGLGLLALILTLAAWRLWPREEALTALPEPAPRSTPSLALKALFLEYGLNAIGIVPHMVFLVDFIARQLGRGVVAGAVYWVVFGAGAMTGAMALGHLADRTGFKFALRMAFAVQAVMVALVAFSDNAVALTASAFVVGAYVPGISVLVLGRLQEISPGSRAQNTAAWSTATIAFSIGQAVSAYAAPPVIAHANYALIFEIGGCALVLALLIDLAVGGRNRGGVAKPQGLGSLTL